MTQPPEPGRPPQGDGGAHEPAAQGPYGATPPPHQPPAPPAAGYGYPQTPPAPNPYLQQPGQQQAPHTPSYGYPAPQPPTVPAPAAAPPRTEAERKALRAQIAIVVSALVAIALIIGGGVWYSGSKDDGGKPVAGGTEGGKGKGGEEGGGTEKVPSDPEGRLLFEVPMPKVEKDLQINVKGSWATGELYAKSGADGITAYDPRTGEQKWKLPLPGPVCFSSRHTTEDGRTAIVHEPAMPTAKEPTKGCSEVTAIDLTTGRKLWTKNAKNGDRPVRFDNVTLSGTTVAAGSSSGGAAWDLTNGSSLWQPKPGDTCYDAGYGGGQALVALRKCGEYGNYQLLLQTLDAKKGTVLSEYKLPEGVDYASIVSTVPLVAAADVGDTAGDGSGISDFFSVDAATGKLRAKISAPGETYAADCDGVTGVEQCGNLAVSQDTLYLPTEEREAGGGTARTNEVVAIDLATGKTGRKADAGEGHNLLPLRMDGDDVLAYKSGPYDKGGQVVRLDGDTLKETLLLQLPNDRASRELEISFSPDYQEFLFSGGRLFMSEVYARGDDKDDEPLAVAFGPKG
ncbi:outer membrane protein assembly factor BamB family protein [Streptomyces fragilis]|uniref:PQQ-binding-like beta-propeller repeat protein n=1 Tax=Streptomyces fragilis TaxID=67301 RepID=A0ABV2YFX5_9ACTN|nr:PQQ-binding-like beta-propeller repeat protein [Streptomyces fragilis]